ncbi:MAG: hypothetical protein ACJ798_10985 [Phenylobacterium sp.]
MHACDPARLAQRWTALWNGEAPASAVVSPDCSVYFGRRPMIARATTAHGPEELQAVVDAVRGSLVSLRYGFAAAPLHQPGELAGEGVVTLLWHVSALGLPRRSGIDLLRHEGGRITEAWSITGDLELPPLRLLPPAQAVAA